MIYRFSDLQLDLKSHNLNRDGKTIHLTNLNFQVLKVLLEAAPSLLSYDELIDQAWGENRVITPENLAQRIKVLRDALGDDAAEPKYIEMVRGQGVRIIPDVERVTEIETTPSPKRAWRTPGLIITGLLIVALV